MLACSSVPFFYARPFFATPTFDGSFISLPCPLLRPLTGPVQTAENFPHVTRMITDAEFALDDIRHPFTGPQIGAITCVQRAAQ